MRLKHIILLCVAAVLAMAGCKKFQDTTEEETVARVNDHYLTKGDLAKMNPTAYEKKDSLQVRFLVNQWATKMLLLDQAQQNFSDKKKERFESLVQDYRENLLVNAYSDLMVEKLMDTVISKAEISDYYRTHSAELHSGENWLKLRYLVLDQNFRGLTEIKQKLKRYNTADSSYLNNRKMDFRESFFEDSLWVKAQNIEKQLNSLNSTNKTLFLPVKTGFFSEEFKHTVVLGVIDSVLNRSDPAPLYLVRDKIEQIIMNQRRLNVKKEFKKDITRDAIENGKFEYGN